jgi:hypothetical protein
MSDVAASGGYFIAMACDTIVAHPNTITGSIGVFGVLPNIQPLLRDKLGITTDRVTTGKFSDLPTITRPLTAYEQQQLQEEVNRIYADFTTKAAKGRNMPVEKLRGYASGRVGRALRPKNAASWMCWARSRMRCALPLAAPSWMRAIIVCKTCLARKPSWRISSTASEWKHGSSS